MQGSLYSWKRWCDTVAWKLDLDLQGLFQSRKLQTGEKNWKPQAQAIELHYPSGFCLGRERGECTQQEQTCSADKNTRATNNELEQGSNGRVPVLCSASLFGWVISNINNLICQKSLFQWVLPAHSELETFCVAAIDWAMRYWHCSSAAKDSLSDS